ncbi:hypothetical protein NEMBOFW57_002152 [Staphylotrichum longicolle]|uniref:Borealin N-terminal domain-containing protein n=1 Tax=Staphylotrichum longicolle TaxID=669026 RepID=A0AAD4F3I2_9PEZI|nr:hypothetical protein NEMBOFW57_002152 [Staphylotrichum longicolle]
MQPLSTKKRKSDQISMAGDEQYAVDMTSHKIPTKNGSPHPQESPFKRQRVGITLAQKQALIDNLHLEITERARKLRANYNIHAQSLRTRIEIRVNRIPLSLRKLTMGELMEKYSTEQQPKPSATTGTARGPPVPAKDKVPSRPPTRGAIAPPSAHPTKRRSHEISGGDKENEMQTPQKKKRAYTTTDATRNPTHVLSPTTSNSRVAPRTVATPGRSGIARPVVTPGRAVLATNILNKMVEGARSVHRPTASTTTVTAGAARKATTSASTATAAARKRGATVTAGMHPAPSSSQQSTTSSRPATRTARRASGTSESSEGSTSTVIRKRPMTAPPGAQPKPPPTAAAAKRTVMGTIKKGVTGGGTGAGRKTPAGTATAAGAKGTGRVLRKRA